MPKNFDESVRQSHPNPTMPHVAARLALFTLLATAASFSDSGRFERWSHFKDYGVPGTLRDPLNRAAIADGSCRLLTPPVELDGFALWWEPARVGNVIAALAAAPATDRPSYFERAANEALLIPCSTPARSVPANFTVAGRAAGIQNWFHALCAPESDPSWKGEYDPAEQPQQMALTAGFACIVACEANHRDLSAASMAALASDPQAARRAVCAALPWGDIDFNKATTEGQLAQMSASLTDSPCACPPKNSMNSTVV